MKFKARLQKEWDENPMMVISVGIAAVATTAKLIDVTSSAHSRRAYAKQVNYRVKTRNK